MANCLEKVEIAETGTLRTLPTLGAGARGAPVAAAKPQRPQRPPPYGNEYYTEKFVEVKDKVDNLLAGADASTAADVYKGIAEALKIKQEPPRQQKAQTTLRDYQGVSLTADAAALFAQRRDMLRRFKASRDAVERKVLVKRIKWVSARANAMGKIAVRRARKSHIADLEWARVNDPHGLAEVMRRPAEGFHTATKGLPTHLRGAYVDHYKKLCSTQGEVPLSVNDPAWAVHAAVLGASRPPEWLDYDWLDVWLAVFGLDAHAAAELERRRGVGAIGKFYFILFFF